MNIEDMLRSDLQAVADTLPTPAPPVASLVSEGTRSVNRRRAYVAGLAAAAVAVVAIGVALGTGGSDRGNQPAPVSPGPSEKVDLRAEPYAWLSGRGVLHVDGEVVEDGGRYDAMVWAGTTVLAWRDNGWARLGDREWEPFTGILSEPHLSPDGDTLAWIRKDAGGVALIVTETDTDRTRTISLDDVTAGGDGGHQGIVGIDGHGRVYFSTDMGQFWVDATTAAAPVRATYQGRTIEIMGAGGAATGPIIRDPGGEIYLAVLEDDVIVSRVRLPDVIPESVSPNGTWVLWWNETEGQRNDIGGEAPAPEGPATEEPAEPFTFSVQRIGADEQHTMELPVGLSRGRVQWESDDIVLIASYGEAEGDYRILRCDVESEKCEYAVPPGN